MNREIKFRGMHVDKKEWRYGHLLSEVAIGKWGNVERYEYYDIIPESVGQYTGLTDKNGKEIYEGDVLKENEYGFFEVVWDKKWARFKLDYKRTNGNIQYPEWNRGIEMEIIGNIYEHPNLLTPIN